MYKSDFIHQYTYLQMASEVGIRMPWPIKNRALYLNATCVIDKDRIHVGMRSNPDNTYLDGVVFEKD